MISGCMEHDDAIPASLETVLDGYDVGRGFGRACPSCEQEYAAGNRLIVTTERSSEASAWNVPSVVCVECGRQCFDADERRTNVEQLLVSVEVASSPMALVLDAETAILLDRSAKTDAC